MTHETHETHETGRIAILDCSWTQGYLYTVHGEDSLLCVADTFFVATSVDGTRYILNTYRQPGFHRDEDGIARPAFNYANDADAFVARVEARGSIDPSRWSRYVEETPAERDAYNLRCERDERTWEGERA